MQPLSGAWPTMVTPYDSNLQIDSGAYRAIIAWYLEHGVGGLYANCLSSEMYHLSSAERLLLVSEAARAAGGRVPVAATGNLGATPAEHIQFCRQVADAGADVVMLVVPDFLNEETELESYFMRMAEQVSAPLGLYECPVPRPFHLSVALAARLAQTGRFVAYKETSCDLQKITAHLEAQRATPLALLQANTPYLLEAVRAGAPGSMCIAAIWLPDLVAAVIRQARAGSADAAALHVRLCALELAQRAVHPLGTKALLANRGLPIAPRGRAHPAPAAEIIHALAAASRQWFDEHGELQQGSSSPSVA